MLLRLLLLSSLVLLVACGGDGQSPPATSPSPRLDPTPQLGLGPTVDPVSWPPGRFFPVTVVVETNKSYLTIGSVTKEESPKGSSWARLIIEGSVTALSSGRFDYRLTVTDEAGQVHEEDSLGVLLGDHAQGEKPTFTTSITVPADATLTRLSYWVAGAERPELSYIIDLPVENIALRQP